MNPPNVNFFIMRKELASLVRERMNHPVLKVHSDTVRTTLLKLISDTRFYLLKDYRQLEEVWGQLRSCSHSTDAVFDLHASFRMYLTANGPGAGDRYLDALAGAFGPLSGNKTCAMDADLQARAAHGQFVREALTNNGWYMVLLTLALMPSALE